MSVRALLCVLLVLLAAQNRGALLPESWARRLLVAIGARSYALYLVHVPAYFAAREIMFRAAGGAAPRGSEIPVALLAAALVVLCAELNWRLVERPLRRRGRTIAARFTARRAGPAAWP